MRYVQIWTVFQWQWPAMTEFVDLPELMVGHGHTRLLGIPYSQVYIQYIYINYMFFTRYTYYAIQQPE